MTENVPWGYICGFPTDRGDLYGGAHYITSGSATLLTRQGKAIVEAATKFGDGQTLPFTPCKKGYAPFVNVVGNDDDNVIECQRRLYACPLHHEARMRRFMRDGGLLAFRRGEVDLTTFWQKRESSSEGPRSAAAKARNEESNAADGSSSRG